MTGPAVQAKMTVQPPPPLPRLATFGDRFARVQPIQAPIHSMTGDGVPDPNRKAEVEKAARRLIEAKIQQKQTPPPPPPTLPPMREEPPELEDYDWPPEGPRVLPEDESEELSSSSESVSATLTSSTLSESESASASSGGGDRPLNTPIEPSAPNVMPEPVVIPSTPIPARPQAELRPPGAPLKKPAAPTVEFNVTSPSAAPRPPPPPVPVEINADAPPRKIITFGERIALVEEKPESAPAPAPPPKATDGSFTCRPCITEPDGADAACDHVTDETKQQMSEFIDEEIVKKGGATPLVVTDASAGNVSWAAPAKRRRSTPAPPRPSRRTLARLAADVRLRERQVYDSRKRTARVSLDDVAQAFETGWRSGRIDLDAYSEDAYALDRARPAEPFDIWTNCTFINLATRTRAARERKRRRLK